MLPFGRTNLLRLVLNRLKEDDDLMLLSKFFQLLIQKGKKLLSYLFVLGKGRPNMIPAKRNIT